VNLNIVSEQYSVSLSTTPISNSGILTAFGKYCVSKHTP
jgi:hypothetical protein